jgi:hypothetical protein
MPSTSVEMINRKRDKNKGNPNPHVYIQKIALSQTYTAFKDRQIPSRFIHNTPMVQENRDHHGSESQDTEFWRVRRTELTVESCGAL